MTDAHNSSVYLVAGRQEVSVNDRVKKLLTLRDRFHAVTLVTPGPRCSTAEQLCVPPVVGITGLLRVLKLNSLKAAIDRYVYFPSLDIRFVWALHRPLLERLRQDIKEGRNAIVVLTFPPHALGRLALVIKEELPQVRVVLDWQDLWSFDPNYFERSPRLFRGRVRRWEEEFVAAADLHLATNQRAAAVLMDRYRAPEARVRYIEHHYHPDDLLNQAVVKNSLSDTGSPIRLAFMGTLDKPPRVPGRELLEVIRQVNKLERRVELHVYGNVPAFDNLQLKALAGEGIIFHGLVSHEEATQALLEYDVLVLLLADMPNSRVVLSIKLPHYLLANKPILAVVPQNSAIADVITKTRAGQVVDSSAGNGTNWPAALVELLTDESRLRSMAANRSEQAIDEYHWDNIAPRWVAAILGDVA